MGTRSRKKCQFITKHSLSFVPVDMARLKGEPGRTRHEHKDENILYWLDDEMEEMNFHAITEETDFYINQNNDVVICFNEGDVAPMYMGMIEFEIPAEVLKKIRK